MTFVWVQFKRFGSCQLLDLHRRTLEIEYSKSFCDRVGKWNPPHLQHDWTWLSAQHFQKSVCTYTPSPETWSTPPVTSQSNHYYRTKRWLMMRRHLPKMDLVTKFFSDSFAKGATVCLKEEGWHRTSCCCGIIKWIFVSCVSTYPSPLKQLQCHSRVSSLTQHPILIRFDFDECQNPEPCLLTERRSLVKWNVGVMRNPWCCSMLLRWWPQWNRCIPLMPLLVGVLVSGGKKTRELLHGVRENEADGGEWERWLLGYWWDAKLCYNNPLQANCVHSWGEPQQSGRAKIDCINSRAVPSRVLYLSHSVSLLRTLSAQIKIGAKKNTPAWISLEEGQKSRLSSEMIQSYWRMKCMSSNMLFCCSYYSTA